MPDERTNLAIEAAAKAFHARDDKRQLRWEDSSEEWRQEARAFVRPIVEAALTASDAYMAALAAVLPKPK